LAKNQNSNNKYRTSGNTSINNNSGTAGNQQLYVAINQQLAGNNSKGRIGAVNKANSQLKGPTQNQSLISNMNNSVHHQSNKATNVLTPG